MYQFFGCALFAVLMMAVVGFASIMKKDEPKAEEKPELERVERSWCCFAPVEQGVVRHEPADVCSACGQPCDVGVFLRDPWDGMLSESETGEKVGQEQPGREPDSQDPDEAGDLRREDHPRSRS